MKKINWKKAVGVAFAGFLGLQVMGCGGSETENTTTAREFVYVPEFQKLKAENGVDEGLTAGDMLYYRTGSFDETTQMYMEYLAKLKIGEDTPELMPLDFGENSSIQRIQLDEEGNIYALVSTYVYDEDGEEAVSAGEEADMEDGEAAPAGEEMGAEGEEEMPAGEEAGTEGEETGAGTESETAESEETVEGQPAGEEETGSGEELSYEVVEENGRGRTYFAAGRGSMTVSPGEESGMPTQIIEICKLSGDGNLISRTDISESLGNSADAYAQDMEIDKEGNLYIGFDQSVLVFDKDGKEVCKIEIESWIQDIFSAKNGDVFAVYYGEMDIEVHPIDIKAKAMGDAEKNIVVGSNGNYRFATGTDSDVVFSADNNLYTYSFGDEAPEKILNWIDCDIDRDDVRSFTILDDGRILVMLSGWDNESGMSTTELVYLTKKKGSEVPEQKILTYGTLYLDYFVRKEIIEFNRTNPEYRIEVKEYVTDNSIEGYDSGQEQMNTDIISGKGPDIIELSGGNMQIYAAKGILEDLYPYMDADEEINKEDYVESVRKAFEVDGKLYTMPSRFYVNTVLAKVSSVGDRQSITLDELMQIMDGLPENAQIYEYATKSSTLMYNIMMNMDEYVNWNTGECKFNSDDFVKALEFANRFDTEFQYNQSDLSRPAKIQQGLLLMTEISISSVEEYILYEAMFREPVAFVGYPTTKENGSFLSHDGSILAINAKSKNKDGAWQFIRQQLTKDAQESNSGRGGGFPVMKSALEKQFEEAMTEEYYEDEEGNKKRSEKTTWGYEDFTVRIYAAKDYEVEAIRNLIENTDTLYQYDQKMMEIITEEANAFFEGQKSAKEVADIIQNRIQVYVNENR